MQLLWLISEAASAGWVWEEGKGLSGCGPASPLGLPGNPTSSRSSGPPGPPCQGGLQSLEEGGPWGVGQWRLGWGGNGGQGGFAGLTSRWEPLLVHIFFPFWCCQFQKEDSDWRRKSRWQLP